MRNNLTWYDRDSNAHRHPKFKVLRLRHGWAAEGRFWALNGMIAEAEGCILNYSTTRDKMAVMAELDFANTDELETFIAYLLSEECQLLFISDGGLTNDRLQEALVLANKTRENSRARVQNYRRSVPKSQPEQNSTESACNALQSQCNALQPECNALHSTELCNVTAYIPTHNTTVHNTTTETNVSGELGQDLKKAYSALSPKDISVISRFINSNKPTHPDPYFDLWNCFAAKYSRPAVKALNENRKKKLQARLRNKEFDFVKILSVAAVSTKALELGFLTFDWLIENETNFLKVLEGNYLKDKPTLQQAATPAETNTHILEAQNFLKNKSTHDLQ